MLQLNQPIASSHVGSFPLPFNQQNVARALHDMMQIGVTYPPYPQLRDFVSTFMHSLVKKGILQPVSGAFIVKDLRAFEELHKLEVSPPEEAVQSIRQASGYPLRAPLTGPVTIASEMYLSSDLSQKSWLLARKDLVLGPLAEYLAKYAESFAKLGYHFLVVDEPSLVVILGKRISMYGYKQDEIAEAINKVLKRASTSLKGVHICGILPPQLKDILFSLDEVEIYDHETFDTPKNLDFYTRRELEEHDKYLAIGVVSSKTPKVEDFKEALKFAEKAVERFGDRVVMVKPDCGFFGLKWVYGSKGEMVIDVEAGYSAALSKLRVVQSIALELSKRLAH